MLADAGDVYRRAVAENPTGTRHTPGLTFAGSMAAIDAAGSAGLRQFIMENELASSNDPGSLLALADAALMVSDAKVASEYVQRALASRTSSQKIWQVRGMRSRDSPIY